MIRFCGIFLCLLIGSLTYDAHAQQGSSSAFAELRPVWQPSFEMGLRGEAAKWGKNVSISEFLSRVDDDIDHGCLVKITLFYFRVNAAGAVDSIYFKGGANENVAAAVKSNILATEGKWKMPESTVATDKCWFVYPFVDAGRYKSCSDRQQVNRNALLELLRLYSGAESAVGNRSQVILPPNRFHEYSER